MALDSAQAKVIAAQPRITPEDHDRLVHLLAEGKKPAELAVQFGKAVGTIYNFQTRNKDAIDALRRKRTVQFDHLAWVRKQARLDSLEKVGNTGEMLMRAHLASCFATDPITGEQEFVERLVDSKKLKDYADMVFKAAKGIMIATGQQLRLDEKWIEKALGVDGAGGVDYGELVQKHAEWVAEAPERERQAAVRKEWHWYDMEQRYASVSDLERAREQPRACPRAGAAG